MSADKRGHSRKLDSASHGLIGEAASSKAARCSASTPTVGAKTAAKANRLFANRVILER